MLAVAWLLMDSSRDRGSDINRAKNNAKVKYASRMRYIPAYNYGHALRIISHYQYSKSIELLIMRFHTPKTWRYFDLITRSRP